MAKIQIEIPKAEVMHIIANHVRDKYGLKNLTLNIQTDDGSKIVGFKVTTVVT